MSEQTMTIAEAKQIIDLLTQHSIVFESGLSSEEIEKIQKAFGFIFPPDLNLFLQSGLPVSEGFINWRRGLDSQQEADKIKSRLE
ncbi:MAG TPA: hypothetical protein VK783_14255 [Bacteroidia bacterium]|nr:hypothetical protein [Bacteroidia bacterium]